MALRGDSTRDKLISIKIAVGRDGELVVEHCTRKFVVFDLKVLARFSASALTQISWGPPPELLWVGAFVRFTNLILKFAISVIISKISE